MKKVMKFGSVFLFLIIIFGLREKSYASNEEITYQAAYESAISYKVTITGLEEEDEEYLYSAIVSQDTDITASDFFYALGPSFSIQYDETTKQWTGTTHENEFEKQGQYYIYVAKLKKGSTHYEIIDGPTKIETPKLPTLGERLTIYAYPGGTTVYMIKVNAIDTQKYRKIERKIKFYLGEITDKTLLEKIEQEGKAAYEELLKYAKKQKTNLKEDSFKETDTGVLEYNIVEDYPIENGKYYFLYSILDDENGTYIEVEDIEAYNGYKMKDGQVGLKKFKYEEILEEEEEKEIYINQVQNEEVIQDNNKEVIQDNTIAKNPIPQTGSTLWEIAMFLGVIFLGVVMYNRYLKYKDIT